MPVFRFIAFLLLVGLLAVVGVSIYNAGVSAGIGSDIGHAIASGAPIPAGYYGPYVGHPWGGGFGFGGFLIGIFFLFLFFGLIRAIFGFGAGAGTTAAGMATAVATRAGAIATTVRATTSTPGTRNGTARRRRLRRLTRPDLPGPMRTGGRCRPSDYHASRGTHPRRR
jgi:hypothetical protein